MQITASLRQDHDALVKFVIAFRKIVQQHGPPAGTELVDLRHAFSKRLLAHLNREDMVLYPALAQSVDLEVAQTAQKFMQEMGGLLMRYKGWSARWPTERILLEWPDFVEETDELLDALSFRIERENAQLYPLLEGDIAAAP